jgi:hypothetical protein
MINKITQCLIPINIVYETVIAGLVIILSGQIVNFTLNYSGFSREGEAAENVFEKAFIPGVILLFICIASIVFRASRKNQLKKVLMSVVLYSYIIGAVFWAFFAWVILTDNAIFRNSIVSHFLYNIYNISILALYVVPLGLIWLLFLSILAVLYKLLKNIFYSFLVKRSSPPAGTWLLFILILAVLYMFFQKIFNIIPVSYWLA